MSSTLTCPEILSKAYLNNKMATTEGITPDGWFKTGDIATRDDEGFYYIVDRRKELIKYKVIRNRFVFLESHTEQPSGFPRWANDTV